LSDGNGAPGRS